MAVSREDIALLVAGFIRAFPAHMPSERVAAWLKNMHVIGNALRLDPGDVEFAIQGFLDDLHAEHAEEPFLGEAPEDDLGWAARTFAEEAKMRDDYAEPGDMVPDDVAEWLWPELEYLASIRPDVDESAMFPDDSWDPLPEIVPDLPGPVAEAALEVEFADPGAIAQVVREIETTGPLCEVSGHDRTTLAIVRDRFRYVRSIKENSPRKEGAVTLVSLFSGAVAAESMETYESMTAPFLPKDGACGWHQAQQIARMQDTIPFLKDMPKGIVIDFPAIRARGTEGEYGVLRMKRDTRNVWNLCFEWVHSAEYRKKTELFSENVRIAIFKPWV